MTSYGAPARTMAAVITALLAFGCGTSSDRRARINLLEPSDKAELTIDDDVDPNTSGVQVEVRARTQSIRSGTPMLLVIADEAVPYFSTVGDDGLVVFEKPTLPPGTHSYTINTATGAVASDSYSYTLKTLVIESPRDGQGIAFGDDLEPDREGLQINITVKAYAVDGNEDIVLSVDGADVGSPVSPDQNGVAVFKSVTLASGTHKLRASAGKVESSETTISVNPACASVSWVTPRVPDGDRLTLGGGEMCPKEPGDDYTIDVEISTDAGEGREVELVVNTTTKRTTKVQGSLAVFEDVPLNQRMSANKLSVTVQGAGGVTCMPVPFPKDVFVDCAGSDCAIGAPVPYTGKDAAGEPAFYLNRSMLSGTGFEFRIDSDSGVLGRQLELIVDKRDGEALRASAEPNGNKVSATFEDVRLAPGPHRIEARCRDASGNVTESGESVWVVDTEPCSIDIQEPQPDQLFLPGDDVDMDADNGVQIAAWAAIQGSDCIERRAAICDPGEDISGTGFAPLENGELREHVTLETDAEQTLCVEARDRADNVERATLGVKFRSVLPNVRIEAPADGSSFNVAGNDGKAMDSEPATTACEADFRVLCSELGAAVELHRDDENGPVVASGTCEAPASGDADLPEGFRGRAKLDDAEFLQGTSTAGILVATQTVQGSAQALQGKSEPIELSGKCEPPRITLYPGCPASQIELPGVGNATLASLNALYIGELVSQAPPEATLTVTALDGTPVSTQTTTFTNQRYAFSNVDLGNTLQTVETKIAVTDTYANVFSVSCQTMLVSDLPTLRINSPASGITLAPLAGCDPGVADKYGVRLTLALDQTSERQLSYNVNGGSATDLTITGTSMMPCIPVDDGMNTLNLQLASTSSPGLAKASLTLTVNMLEITQPAAGSVLLPADDACDAGFGARVIADVAPAFEGEGATVSAGATQVAALVSGGHVDTCVPLPAGSSTLTVALDGTTISRSVDVTVATGAPSTPIALTSVTQPADGSGYRNGSVTLGWATPSEDYPGQLKAYELRCAATAIQASASGTDKDNWWSAAEPVPFVAVVAPPATTAQVTLRTGETLQCVLRGRDGANQLTPIPDSTQVTHAYREQRVDVSELNRMGHTLSSVGDVNGDGVNDVLIGGSGRAYLYFGNAGGLTAKSNAMKPDVTFRGAPGIAQVDFGTRVAALGDINGDGRNDFAIAHPTWSSASPSVGQAGAAYLFYGRSSSDAWPLSVDLTTTDLALCGADVCFYGEVANEFLGFSLAAAGDFNSDGRPDIALAAAGRPSSNETLAGRQYVLLGRSFEGSGGRSESFWKIPIRLPSGDPRGFYVDGAGSTGDDTTSSAQFGTAAAGVGNVDAVAGSDLLITAPGRASASISAKLYFLSGRTHSGTAPQLKAISNSELVLKVGGQPNTFGSQLVPLRNFYDGTQSGIVDVALFD
ncbi:MAG TPA: VCBS repeat-containing protein, partial [Polyangiales bacterium]|nr:VCBS repeat-containing protein [Polyangiales bacterium]